MWVPGDVVVDVSSQTEDMFFDPDDMDKFADGGTMDDDLEGASRVIDQSCEGECTGRKSTVGCEIHRSRVCGHM